MEAMKRLDAHLVGRVRELAAMKKNGIKIVGYGPGGYIPEEMIYAAGAVPVCLARGGDIEPTIEGLSYMTRFVCVFNRSQIGYYKLGEYLEYQLPDLYVTNMADCNNKAGADLIDFYTKIPGFRIGVPHGHNPWQVDYYTYMLGWFKKVLEELTGNEITDEKLRKEIEWGNKRRDLFKAISYLRKGADPVLTSAEYIKLHHASFYADKEFFIEVLEDIYQELAAKRVESKPEDMKRPRIMLVASTMAYGDIRLHDLLAETSGEIVYEEVNEGLHPYEQNIVVSGGDLIADIADAYFTRRLIGPWDRPWDGRYEALLAKAREFDCDGVMWYHTMFRDGPDMQGYAFGKKFKNDGLHFVRLETEYTNAEIGPFRTRLETFVELMKTGAAVEAVGI